MFPVVMGRLPNVLCTTAHNHKRAKPERWQNGIAAVLKTVIAKVIWGFKSLSLHLSSESA